MTVRGGGPTPTELRNMWPRGLPTYPLGIAKRWHRNLPSQANERNHGKLFLVYSASTSSSKMYHGKNLADTTGRRRDTQGRQHYKQTGLRLLPVVIFEICVSSHCAFFFNTPSRAPYHMLMFVLRPLTMLFGTSSLSCTPELS